MNVIREFYEQKNRAGKLTFREFRTKINIELKPRGLYIRMPSLHQWTKGVHKLTVYPVAEAIAKVIGCTADDVIKSVNADYLEQRRKKNA